MEDPQRQDEKELNTNFFGEKKNALLAILLLPATLAIVLIIAYLYVFDVFKPEPRVEVQAKNTFEKTLRVVTDGDYAPFSYISEDDEAYLGLDVELINEIANRLEMNLDLKLLDWSSVNKKFLEGDADIIMNMESDLIINSPDMIATLPISEKQYVVYGKRKVSSVADLYGRRVASLHRVPGLGLDDEITYVDSYEVIFEALKRGEYEFAICPVQVGNSFLEKLNMDEFFPSYAVTHVYGSLALHPEDTILRVRLNAVLKQMYDEGRMDALNKKWIRHRYENMTVMEMVENRPWLSAGILIAFVFVLLLIFYVFFQYKNSRAQKNYTKNLKRSFDTIERQQKELQARQVELIDAKDRAEQSSRAKTNFLSNMSHDIRTPMNAIIGYTNLAQRQGVSPKEMQDFLSKIETSSKHLLSLINDVLEMSRIESGRMELDETEANIVRLIKEIGDMFSTQMQTKNISFRVDTDVKNSFVLCDENRLNRILLNLIGNAYKFTPEGGKISISLKQIDERDYEIRVKDSGIGMSEEFAKEVFEPFTRERTSTVSGIQGTGLGMAITKNFVDLMGGKISVITAPNQGTEFIVTLPLKIVEKPEEELLEEKIPSDSAEKTSSQPKKLLLVEDIEVNREIALMILTEAGFEVETAVNGKEAVEKVLSAKPGDFDAILMDIQMPVMNGYEATKKIREEAQGELAKIPIIAMTANAFSEDVENARAAGMNAHIAKPIDIPKMMETLNKVLDS